MAEAGESAEAGAEAGQSDAVLLAPLTEDTFLHNLLVRYKRDLIYTYVGNALVSVNPCRALPLYSAELVRAYLARAPYQLPPHLYAITATAYRWVRDRSESQCIIITGESGAGKTEAARVCLQCAVLAGGGAGGAGAELTAAGTLLEAFGNAATARNHNASRFERASRVPEGERNFHVLYQLLAGADVSLLKRLRLQRSWEQYAVLRGGAARDPPPLGAAPALSPRRASAAPPATSAAQADKDHFAFTKMAMVALGFGAAECGGVLRVLAFLLKLGNVQFEPAHNIDGSIGTRLRAEYELEEACALVGVSPGELATALGASHPAPHARPPEEEGEMPEVEESEAEEEEEVEVACGAGWARARRDRVLSALYARLFTWLVTAVNQRLKGGAGGATRRGTLGILDVYGLESLAHNGLERLLINYAAERLQAAVVGATLRREQEEYAREGLAWAPLRYPDPDLGADLLDAGPESVLGALREAGSDASFVARLSRRRHPRLAPLPPHHFTVVHFGGPVVYCARGMVSANRDAACRRAHLVLARARDPLLAALFASPAPVHAAGSPRRAATLACRQRALLAALLRRLPPAPRLVRCLRADAALRPRRADAALLRHQLRSQGIIEMAQLRRAGWCESMCARDVVARYALLRPGVCAGAGAGAGSSAVRAARALLRALPIPSAEFAYGRTRVFIRSPRTVWELEASRAARVEALVEAAQRAWRAHRARSLQRRREHAHAVIARAWRAYRATRELPERRALRRQLQARQRVAALGGAGGVEARCWGARVAWRAWSAWARRRYLSALWRRLPARHLSPACGAWPACPWPALLARADALLRRVHHRWRCALYRRAFDQTARNRMREKVTASVLFRERKALYARSVPHPFVGDYVRLRASAAWRRGVGAQPDDRYVVFADVVGKVLRASGSGRAARCLAVLSTHALLLLDPRSLRLKRRLPAHRVFRLSLSPHDDDLLVVHVRAASGVGASAGAGVEMCAGVGAGEGCGGGGGGALSSSPEEASQSSSRDAPDAAGCLFAGEGVSRRRRGDVVLRTRHVLELATKLFLVVQNACGTPPHVNIADQFEADFGGQPVTITFHALPAGAGAEGSGGVGGGARLVRRGSRVDVLL